MIGAPSTLNIQSAGGDVHIHRYGKNFKFLTNGNFFGAAKGPEGELLRMVVGQTEPGVGWATYSSGVAIDIDTSVAEFTAMPFYFPTLHGSSHHWKAIGVTSVYKSSPSSFRIALRGTDVDLSRARDNGWYIVWLAVGV